MISKIFILIIKFYQKALSPFKGPCCRYTPTCSEYVKQSIEKRGLIRAIFPSIKRVLSCHPFSKKTLWDPVK